MSDNQELQNMVLDILAPDEEEEVVESVSLEELAESHHSEAEVLAKCHETSRLLLENQDRDYILTLVSDLAAIIKRTTTGRYSQLSPGYYLALMLLDYLRDRKEAGDIIFWITHYADELELRLLTRDNRRRMAYLEDRWGDDTADQIAEILNTRKPTVQKWLDGNNPSSSNAAKMDQIITVLFRLHKRAGMSEEAALDWLNSHNGKLGDSPRNILKDTSYWGMPPDLQQELKNLGAYE